MIYITGDTHGLIDYDRLKTFFENTYVTKNDILIILGDAGIIWSNKEKYIKEYELLGPTILYIDGNHENFDLLKTYPIKHKYGAKVHQISNKIFHILRGEILNINNITFLCLGGASSIDKMYRKEHVSWWEDENISYEDISNALSNIKKYNYKVNYVLTHCCPSRIVKILNYQTDSNTKALDSLFDLISFDKWYFGHYHIDKSFLDKYRCFYYDIETIKIPYKSNKVTYSHHL